MRVWNHPPVGIFGRVSRSARMRDIATTLLGADEVNPNCPKPHTLKPKDP